VDNQDVWGVMIVNANATSGVWAAITSGAEWTREPIHCVHSMEQKADKQPGEPSLSSFQNQEISMLPNNTSFD